MSVIKFNNIKTLANDLKKYVEKKGELPKELTVNKKTYSYPQMGYIFAKSIVNIGKDIEVIKVDSAPSPSGETVNLKLTTNEYKSIARNLVTFIQPKNSRRLPNYLTGKGKKIKQRVFIYSFAKIIVFYSENKRLPTSCTFKTSEVTKKTSKTTTSTKKTTTSTSTGNCTNPYTSSPHYTSEGVGKLGQITAYHCGPNMVHQMLRKFGVTKYSQDDIARLAGTTSSGTDPDGLKTAIEYISRKEGLNLKVERKYMSDFGNNTVAQFTAIAKLMCNALIFIGYHLGYQNSGEKSKDNDGKKLKVFGHYETADKIDVKNKKIRVLNSLGSKCSSKGYCGHLQWRSFDLQKTYINNKTGVKSVWIITKQ